MLLRPAPLNRTKLRSLDGGGRGGRGGRRRHRQFFSESETETSSLAAHGELLFISREAEAAAGRAAARKDPNQNNPDRIAPSYELIELHSGCHAKRVAPFVFCCGRSCDLICIIIVICPWHVACQKARGEGAATATEMQMGIIGGRRRRRRKRNSRQCCVLHRQREREKKGSCHERLFLPSRVESA